jgi:hypothetical protein
MTDEELRKQLTAIFEQNVDYAYNGGEMEDLVMQLIKQDREQDRARHALEAYTKWYQQGRSAEQIHGVRNYLTGAYGIELDPEVPHE